MRIFLILIVTANVLSAANTFTVASYNVENYFLSPFGTRKAKPAVSRAKVREAILKIQPDVLALQEIGRRAALNELLAGLKSEGLSYPHIEWVQGPDLAIHLVVLSRFPFAARKSHLDVEYALDRQRFRVSRGFGEVTIRVNDTYKFTLLNAHLKSKRPVPKASQAEMRLSEARELRRIIEERLKADTNANLMVVGDLNDTQDQPAIRTLLGSKAPKLVDLRPCERNGDRAPHQQSAKFIPRRVAWTSFYWKEDSYSRFDYLIASTGMNRELRREGTFVQAMADWGLASDHRLVVSEFFAEER
ncbi:endonuclease/exonuclease/phosphatase family protein [Verrucomicrobia bacterium]|nr:endonuclease/exonuclease/phosphatase family protein [Verrucomicrobiota bacterium]MDC0219609.1 endonuclease/exonuclease/phosphatase family protein [Verrucomicrobiota bacterium]